MKSRIRYLASIPFVRDIATMQIGGAMTIGINLTTSIVYARVLGLSGYGTYALVLAFTGTIASITNWGQASSMSTFFAEQFGKKNTRGMADVLAYFLVMTALSGALTLALIYVTPFLSAAAYSNSEIAGLARLSLYVIILNAIPSLFFGLLQIVREIKLMTILDQAVAILHLIISSALLMNGNGVASIFLSRIALLILLLPVCLYIYRRLIHTYGLPTWSEIFRSRLHSFKEYFVQGIWIGLDKNIGNLYPNIFLTIIGMRANEATVGLARIAFQLSMVPRQVLLAHANQLAGTVLPTIAANGMRKLRATAVRLLKHALFFHAIVSIGALLAMPIAVPLLYGWSYAQAIPTALWLTLILIMSALSVNNTPLLRLLRKTYISTIFGAVSIVGSCAAMWLSAEIIGPLNALIMATFAYYAINQLISAYVYLVLLRTE